MFYQQISISSIFLGALIYSTYAEEVLIQIVVKKPINIVSDRYVSFAMDPGHLLDLCLRPSKTVNATILAQNLGSAYFKIDGGTTDRFTLDDERIPVKENQARILPSDWQALHQWLNGTNLKPIVSLPYTSKHWSPRNIINILGISNRLGIQKCVWQLGSELNATEIIDYVDALSTLKSIVDVFRQTGSDWSVIGADISTGCRSDEADLYAELSKHISEANGWTQSVEYNSLEQDNHRFFETDPALRSLLRSKAPVWLNVPKPTRSLRSELCGLECQFDGIRWANTLGSRAQNGFKVVFQRVDKFDVINPSLSYYVSLLHKKLMGTKVFDTKMLNGDNLSPKYFAHCTRNMSGSFSVMGVNALDYQTTTSTKLPSKYTGSEIYQYILYVDNGHIVFNGVPVKIDSNWQPLIKVKKQNRMTTFTLPPRSIGFWVFPLANLQQCSTKTEDEYRNSPAKPDIYNDLENSSRTASEKLLHELISEILQIDREINEVKRSRRHAVVKKDSKHMNRIKRDADPGYKTRRAVNMFKKFNDKAAKPNLGAFVRPRRRVARQINNNFNYNNRFAKLFQNFELPQPKKFQLAKFWNLPPPTQNTIAQNRVTIPPVTSTIHDVYSVDPSEQIFKSVENSELPTGDIFFQVGDERNMDYVEFDEKSEKFGKPRLPHRMDTEKFVDFDVDDDVQDIPHMYEFQDAARDNRKPPSDDMIPYTELWESDVYQKAPPPQPTNERSDFIEDANNREQQIDLIVTKQLPPTFRQNQENLMQAKNKLNSIYMSDGDRMSATDNMPTPIRHYDMDDDGFFVSKRKRRSINANMNDEIEMKVNDINKASTINGEDMQEFVEFLNKNGSKINLLEKITKLIESLEKIDDIGKYKNIEKLTAEIKELENFLFKRNLKFGVLKPKNRVTQKEIRRKCKILSVNLEQQCLKENDFHPSRLINREANKQTADYKPKKAMATLKNVVFPPKKSSNHNRIRRNTHVYGSSSWEADERNNMIFKELYEANELNHFVPAISFIKSAVHDDQPGEVQKEYIEQVSVLQDLPDSYPSNVMQVNDDPRVQQPSDPNFSVHTNLDGKFIEKDLDHDQMANEYHTPRFMRKITNTVQDWMNVVEKHVSGWWHILS